MSFEMSIEKDGQPTADFLNFVAMGKPAEIIEKYCEKGSQLGIVSRVQTRNWEDKDGNKHYTTEFLVEDFTFIGGNKNSSGSKRETSSEDEDFVL
jgi:single-strand DNA-binding protein